MDIILFIQSYTSPWLDTLFYYVTNLGSIFFYLILISFIHWVINKKIGFRMALLMSISALTNLILKTSFQTPRPDAGKVRVLYPETAGGFAFPSFHAQGALTFFGYSAIQIRKHWFTFTGIFIVLIISFSRLYLGVHFPADILGGWAAAILLLLIFNYIIEPLFHLLEFTLITNLLLSLIIPPLFLLIINQNIQSYQLVGTLMGICAGYSLEIKLINFTEKTSLILHLIKMILGLGVLVTAYLYLDLVPTEPLYWQTAAFALFGIWITFLAPVIFRLLHLEY